MDCVKIGNLIAKLRKEKNLPREILQMHWVFKIKLFQNGKRASVCLITVS